MSEDNQNVTRINLDGKEYYTHWYGPRLEA